MSNPKLNILFVAHDNTLYGANRSLINLLNGLGGRVNPIVLIPTKGEISDVLEGIGVTYIVGRYHYIVGGISLLSFYKYPLIKRRNQIANKKSLNCLLHQVSGLNIDIIHSNSSVISIGYDLAKRLNVKHVWHLREFQDLDHNLFPFGGMKNLILKIKSSDAIICISKCIAKRFEVEDTSFILYNAVKNRADSKYTLRKSDYFVFCGVLKRNKGIIEAIWSFAMFKKTSVIDIKLHVAGYAPNFLFRKYLKLLVFLLKLKQDVIFLGFQKNVDELMYNASAVLMFSRYEAMGRVTAEAMLLGCPVIGFNRMGTAELVSNDFTGLLFNSRPEAVEKMHFLTLHPNERNAIIQNAYNEAILKYVEDGYADKVLDIYLKLTNN